MIRCEIPPFSTSETKFQSRLPALDARIRTAKRAMDPLFSKERLFKKATSLFSPYRDLPTVVSDIVCTTGVNNAWVKAYELICQTKIIDEIMKNFPSDTDNSITHYNVYGMSGAFIQVVEYYLKQHHGPESKQPLEHEWFTHLYGDYDAVESEDQGLPRLYLPNKVDAIALHDMSYSLDSSKNPILSIKNGPGWKENEQYTWYNSDLPESLQYILAEMDRYELGPKTCKLFTGDLNIDFDVKPKNFPLHMEQELIYSRHLMAQVIYALFRLDKGGCIILKMFSFFSPFVTSIIALFSKIFGKLELVKPASAKSDNSEIYIIGYSYNRSGDNDQIVRQFIGDGLAIMKNTSYSAIMEMLTDEQKRICDFMNTTVFDIQYASKEWLDVVYAVAEKFVIAQETAINANIREFGKFKDWERKSGVTVRGAYNPNLDTYINKNLAARNELVLNKWCIDNGLVKTAVGRKLLSPVSRCTSTPIMAKSKSESRLTGQSGLAASGPVTPVAIKTSTLAKYNWTVPKVHVSAPSPTNSGGGLITSESCIYAVSPTSSNTQSQNSSVNNSPSVRTRTLGTSPDAGAMSWRSHGSSPEVIQFKSPTKKVDELTKKLRDLTRM